QRLRIEYGDPCRGELDGQWQSVEPAADFFDRVAMALEVEGRVDITSACREQVCRAVVYPKRRHRDEVFAVDRETFATRCEHCQRRRRREHRLDEIGDGVDDVFTVVDDDEDTALR